ncbi:hypothetical protein V4D30_08585 [Thermodesulfovibrio sp. 3907-1M]|uniref:Uncharacterized protein n=1 Tax=Thermodesulfovibrio autotrophicus TaxID=3118333 RepID=A0AAU8GV51_9BACT
MKGYINLIQNLALKSNLKILYFDFSDFSLIARIGLSSEDFIIKSLEYLGKFGHF